MRKFFLALTVALAFLAQRADASVRPPQGINDAGLNLIKSFESVRLSAYYDRTGRVWTIGYGHTGGVRQGQTITQAQADAFLRQDVASAEAAVRRNVAVPLTSNQFSALVSFAYNVGSGNFANSNVVARLNNRNYSGAANALTMWTYSGGVQLQGLVRRRNAERALFLTP